MRIRKGVVDDLPQIIRIVQDVVSMMNAEGNFQWNETYPRESDFLKDIEAKVLYVAVLDQSLEDLPHGEVVGFVAITTHQPTEYAALEWGNDCTQAIVPHRLGVSQKVHGKGIAQHLMHYCEVVAREQNITCIRVDTNCLNLRMQHIFSKLSFQYIGDVYFVKGEHGRLKFPCYQKLI